MVITLSLASISQAGHPFEVMLLTYPNDESLSGEKFLSEKKETIFQCSTLGECLKHIQKSRARGQFGVGFVSSEKNGFLQVFTIDSFVYSNAFDRLKEYSEVE
jgi:hypothetical protein